MPQYPEGYREFAYIANRGSNTVTVLDLVYLRADRTLQVGVSPSAIVSNPRLNEVYVLNQNGNQPAGSVSVIDAVHNEVVATIPVQRAPSSLVVEPTGRRVFVLNSGSSTISVLDLSARKQIALLTTATHANAAHVAPDGRTLIVTSEERGETLLYTVGKSDTTEPALVLRTSFSGCAGATSPVILSDSAKAFIACSESARVMALNLAMTADSWAVRQDATRSTDSLLAFLDVGQHPANLTLKPDGGEVFVSNLLSDSISEISTQTNEVGSTYAIGNRPTHGVVSADNGALWVSNSGADSISLYSIEDGKFLSSIRTGNAPSALAFSADEHLLIVADSKSGDVAVIRTTSKLGPALFTILPAGSSPAGIAIKAIQPKV